MGSAPEFVFELATESVSPGERVELQVEVGNPTGSVIQGAQLVTVLPDGLSFDRFRDVSYHNSTGHTGCAGSGAPSCAPGDRVEWNLGDLEPGVTVKISIWALIGADVVPGSVISPTFQAASTSGALSTPITKELLIVPQDNVHLQLAVSRDAVVPGESFEYEILVGNSGTEPTDELEVVLDLPGGVAADAANSDGEVLADSVEWSLDPLVPGQSVVLRASVSLDAQAIPASLLVGTATLHSEDDLAPVQRATQTTSVAEPTTLDVAYELKSRQVFPGGRLEYTISVANTSPTAVAENVRVQLRVPEGISLDRFRNAGYLDSTAHSGCAGSGSPSCEAGDEVFWVFERLEAGESISLSVSAAVAATVTPGSLIVAPLFVEADGLADSIQLQRIAPVTTARSVEFVLSAHDDPAAPGGAFEYELRAGNPGSDAIDDLDLTLTLPAGVTVDTIAGDGEQVGDQVIWNVSSLLPGASLVRTVRVTIADDAVQGQALVAKARLTHADGLALDAEAAAVVSVAAPSRLQVDYALRESPATPGGKLEYLISIANTSPTAVTENVRVQLRVPEGVSIDRFRNVSYLDSTGQRGCAGSGSPSCEAGDEVFWTFERLEAGESISLSVSATVAATVIPGSLIVTPLFVEANGLGDSIQLQRVAPVTTERAVDLTLSAHSDPAAPGGSLEYELRAGNTSSDAVNDLALTLTLPTGVTVAAIDGDGEQTGNQVRWNSSSLLPGASLIRTVRVTIADDAVEGQALIANASLTHTGGLALDAEAAAVVSVAAPARLQVDYILRDAPTTPGGKLDYAINIANTSPTAVAENVRVQLRVPEGVSLDRFRNVGYLDSTGQSGCAGSGSPSCEAGDEVFWTFERLEAGESISLSVTATVATTVLPGTLIVAPLFVEANGLGDSIQLQRIAPVTIARPVEFILSAHSDPAAPGGTLEYELRAGNTGSTAVNDLALTLTLPAGVTVDTIAGGGVQVGNQVSWSASSLLPGASLVRTVQVTIAGNAVEGQALVAEATLTHAGGLALDAEAAAVVSVAAPARLQLEVELSQANVAPGGQFSYAVEITNPSPTAIANNVGLQLRVPRWVTINRSSGVTTVPSTGHRGCSGSGAPTCEADDEIFWTIESVGPGEVISFTVLATVSSNATPGSLLVAPIYLEANALGDSIQIERVIPIVAP